MPTVFRSPNRERHRKTILSLHLERERRSGKRQVNREYKTRYTGTELKEKVEFVVVQNDTETQVSSTVGNGIRKSEEGERATPGAAPGERILPFRGEYTVGHTLRLRRYACGRANRGTGKARGHGGPQRSAGRVQTGVEAQGGSAAPILPYARTHSLRPPPAFLYAFASPPRCRTTPAGGAARSRGTSPSTFTRQYRRSRCSLYSVDIDGTTGQKRRVGASTGA
jgi:hypothetical protein